MPTQWRTIAPIIGRTPNQCLERYEKLLAQAVHGEDYDPKADPRKLRPGEIDPHPEAKPARPDPEDMDEDEKEMLAEARARLANTRGKKAKRQAREKQLEEAKRLALLQKKRELRAAGIEVGTRERGKKALDPNAEIVFHARPAPGFHDTREEEARAAAMQREFRPVSYQDLVSNRRKRIEQALLKADAEREARQAEENMAQVVARNLEMNEAGHVQRRGRLALPAPQLSEAELGEVARVARGDALEADLAGGPGGAATRALLAEYGHTPAALPAARTARTAAGAGAGAAEDAVLAEARLQATLRSMQTPLAGGEGVAVADQGFGGGVTGARRPAATPNPLAALATPGRGAAGSRGAAPTPAVHGTPLVPGRGGPAGGETPRRDALGANPGASASWGAEAAPVPVGRALEGLPAPRGGYELALPEAPAGEGDAEMREADAGDVDAARAAAEEAARAAELRARSAPLRRGLPRPARAAAAAAAAAGARSEAERLVLEELQGLLAHDNAKWPAAAGEDRRRKKKRARPEPLGPVPELPPLAEADAAAARALVAAELGARGAGGDGATEALERRDADPRGAAGDDVAGLRAAHAATRTRAEGAARQAGKLEGKLGVLTRGLEARHKELSGRWAALQQALTRAELELGALAASQGEEERRAERRLEAAVEELRGRQAVCRHLQEQFLALQRERRELEAPAA